MTREVQPGDEVEDERVEAGDTDLTRADGEDPSAGGGSGGVILMIDLEKLGTIMDRPCRSRGDGSERAAVVYRIVERVE
jgi:hypothetical protein